MAKKPKFKPVITRVKLNPEQAVLTCNCYNLGNRGLLASAWWNDVSLYPICGEIGKNIYPFNNCMGGGSMTVLSGGSGTNNNS